MPGERRSTGERSEGDLGVAPMDRFVAVPRVIPPASDAASKQGRVLGAAITLWETLRLALDSLRAHKLRSFLTLFGVIMAVTTLVGVMRSEEHTPELQSRLHLVCRPFLGKKKKTPPPTQHC